MKDYVAETDIPYFVPVAEPPAGADRAVVVFAEQTALPWLRPLKPGFRHCCAYLRLPEGWIGVDPLSHWLVLRAFPAWPHGADLAGHLRRQGQCALTVPVAEPPRRLAPPLPFSCVETVKRLIGLQSWRIRTPWELYLHVRKISLDYDPYLFYTSEHSRDTSPTAGREAGAGLPSARAQERKAAMGGLFGSSPPPPPLPPPPPPPPEPEQPSEADVAAEAARERRRRAQADTIATSWRGLGSDAGNAAAPKRLIGD